jgi:hypothetical protein
MWIYPGRHDIFFEPSESPTTFWNPPANLVTRYAFGEGVNEHVFCNTCGVQVFEARERSPAPDFMGWEDDKDQSVTLGVNLATFNGMQELLADGRGEKLGNLVWNSEARSKGGEYKLVL